MMKYLLVMSLVWQMTLAQASASVGPKLGASLGWIERAGAGSRSLNLGGTGLSYDRAELPAFMNPALVAIQRKVNLSLGGENRSLGRTGGHLGIHSPWGNRLGFGYAMLYRGIGDLKVIDSDDNDVGSSRPGFTRHSAAIAWRHDTRMAWGASFDWNSYHPDIEGFESHLSPIRLTFGWFKKWKKHAVAIVARNLGLNPTFTSSDEIQFDADLAATSGVDYYPKTLECEYSFPWRRSRLSIKNSSYLLQDAIWNWDRHYWQHRLGLGLEIPIYRDWALQMGYKGEYWSVQGGVPGNMSGGLSWRIPLEEKRWVEWSLGAILERESQYAPIHLGVKLIW